MQANVSMHNKNGARIDQDLALESLGSGNLGFHFREDQVCEITSRVPQNDRNQISRVQSVLL